MAVPTDNATVRFRQGAGRLCLDFIRTLRYRGAPAATEELTDPAALAAWIGQCGPCEPGAAARDAVEIGEARALREAIHELLQAARSAEGGGSRGAAARELVNRAAAGPVPAPRLDASGHLRWHAEDPVAATLCLVARDALELTASEAVTRVRECADPACGVLFLDTSRPGTRRWCSMDTCGNRAKKRSLRSKR
jgi:predicted RNA-binding Zn ribbon-like protein